MNFPIQKLVLSLRKHTKKIAILFFSILALATVILWLSENACKDAAKGRVFRSTANIPQNEVALVLGTGKTTRTGQPNLHFNQRIYAAVALYHSGKISRLLVSGDNHVKGYDEPSDMREALIAAGVPTNAITCDYAGFHTLDSVARAKSVFGLKECTIVTEEFHCDRALWIAREYGLNAVAFAAPDVKSARWSLRVKVREVFATAWCGVELHLLHKGPRFSGPPEPILTAAR
jgi:SanA protein